MAQVEEKPGVATRTLKNYIGGRWVEAEGSGVIDVTNPANGELLGQVPMSGPSQVDEAARAAREAFPAWRATPPVERARACFELKYLLEEAKDELATLVTRDNGKAIKDASGEVRRGIECVEVATGIPSLMQGSNLEDVSRGIDSDMIRQPIGVFAGITPFNFPFMVPMWFLPFAIACGNTFVLKPSEQDPLASERTFELLDGIGLPAGVVNLVHGGKEAVNGLLEHPGVDGVSFVGSTPVAHYIYETSARHGKRVQALGGAKNHVIVMPDAELESAVDGVLSSAFHAAGQRCLANSVCIAVGEVYEPLRRANLAVGPAQIEHLTVGELAHREPVFPAGPEIHFSLYRSNTRFGYAACEYSLISPPRIVRRCTRAAVRSAPRWCLIRVGRQFFVRLAHVHGDDRRRIDQRANGGQRLPVGLSERIGRRDDNQARIN